LKQMLKRDSILFLKGLLPALFLTVLLALACAAAGYSSTIGATPEDLTVNVALVDTEDSVLSRISVNMVSGQSYMSSLMNIESTDLDTAKAGLSNGDYGAIIILPEGYMDSIMHGKKCSGTIIISDSLENSNDILPSIADFGARLLAAGQFGVFSGEQLVSQYELSEAAYSKYIEDSNTGLIMFALNAYDDLFVEEDLPYSTTGLSLVFYYLACWLTLLLFVCGLFFPDLYTADCKGSIFARLKTRGITSVDFLTGKILYSFIFRCILCVPAIFLLSGKAFLILTLVCLFVTIITSSTALCLSKKGGWVISILGVSAICLFMAGGMVPRTMLPEMLPAIVEYTPFGCALDIVIMSLGGIFSIRPFIISLIYVIIALTSVFIFFEKLDIHSEEVRL